jgi:small subunit ribosomal protein S1
MEKEEIKENLVLSSITERSVNKPEVDALVEGPVILVKKSSVYVDLAPFGTGIIYGREFINAKDVINKINLGDIIKAKIVEAENEDGYIELSLKEAKQALTWSEAEKAIKAKTPFNLEVKDANKGGLILEWQGITGFLPASQLKADHYPRVLDSDKDKILKELKKLVGQNISVMIISTLPKEGKLIFSEKDNNPEEKKEILSKYTVGDSLDCTVAGIVDFGVFLKLEDGLEGLVHISELDWGLVEDPRHMFKVGDKVKAKVIEIKDGKVSLSLKALKENSNEKKLRYESIAVSYSPCTVVVLREKQYPPSSTLSTSKGLSCISDTSCGGSALSRSPPPCFSSKYGSRASRIPCCTPRAFSYSGHV